MNKIERADIILYLLQFEFPGFEFEREYCPVEAVAKWTFMPEFLPLVVLKARIPGMHGPQLFRTPLWDWVVDTCEGDGSYTSITWARYDRGQFPGYSLRYVGPQRVEWKGWDDRL